MSGHPPTCVILGGGGHARVLIDGLLLEGRVRPAGVLDANPALWGSEIYGVPVLGGDEWLPKLASRGFTHFLVGLGGVRDNRPRARVHALALAAGLAPLTFVHPTAFVSPRAALGPGVQIMPLAVVNAGAVLGEAVIVNSGAVVEHDCQLGDHVHVATGARVCSTVRVGRMSHIGAGATIRQLVTIGAHVVVAAGAVVVTDVAAGRVVAGVPAHALGDPPEPGGATAPTGS